MQPSVSKTDSLAIGITVKLLPTVVHMKLATMQKCHQVEYLHVQGSFGLFQHASTQSFTRLKNTDLQLESCPSSLIGISELTAVQVAICHIAMITMYRNHCKIRKT